MHVCMSVCVSISMDIVCTIKPDLQACLHSPEVTTSQEPAPRDMDPGVGMDLQKSIFVRWCMLVSEIYLRCSSAFRLFLWLCGPLLQNSRGEKHVPMLGCARGASEQ